jgi:serine/threonine protein kinase
MIGEILQRRYKIIKELGNGGFGKTYLAEYPCDLPVTPQYNCVIKELVRPPTPDLDTEQRFKKEAAVLFKLGKNHSQIPELYDFFEENRKFYLVQEYIDGQDLSYEINSDQKWSEADVIHLLQEILEVLTFIHEQNVIHRDIKPLNLMRRYSDNKLVLIDFGVVKEISTLEVNAKGKIISTITAGTPGYMPSEQLQGHPKSNSDIFALGMTAIEAITGVSPQELQKDPNTLEVIWREKVQISEALAEILTKMVRYHYTERYADAHETLQALKQAGLPLQSPITSLHPIKIGDKYGYIDQIGRVVIQPQFDDACHFDEGMALIQMSKKYGFINKKGYLVIPTQFDEALYFYEGMAKVKINNKYGYISKTCKLIIQPQFEEADNFCEGLASVKIDEKWGYIDKSGKFVIPPQFDCAWDFCEGLAMVTIDAKWGYIGKSGQFVISPQFEEAWDFCEGLARVQINSKYGYIDKSGRLIIQPQFYFAADFFEGLARVKIDNKYGYIDKSGRLIIQPQFEDSDNFFEGLARVKIDNKYGYIDKSGRLIIQPQFEDSDNFFEGLARVKIDNKYGYIDKNRHFAIQSKFDNGCKFYKGLARVKIGEQERYLDKKGRFIY